ncbi:hypothetical protein HPB47_010577 [Ixodes persulcatus]|uniref:Uncharacterized protein n=1 Tax=Ixodes persulcatus TaxID=34615 RepID=A0AC60NYR0_IXOPE|nr:hypothetical protein HPB47_010577 [Ixodes persulcatus]
MLVTGSDDASDGLEDVRYLFEACHLGSKNDPHAAGHSRRGTSFDEGYASSSSKDDDSDPTSLVTGLSTVCIDDAAVLRRGPTRTRDDRPRPQPYGHQQEYHDEQWREERLGARLVLPSSPPKPDSGAPSAGSGGIWEWTLGSPLSQPSPVEPLELRPEGCAGLECVAPSNLNALSRDGLALMGDIQAGQPHQELVDDLGALLLAEPAQPDGVDSIKRYLMDEAPLAPGLPELDIEDVLSVLPAIPIPKEQRTQPPMAPPLAQESRALLEGMQAVQANSRRYLPILPKDPNTSTRGEDTAQTPASCQRQSRVEKDALRAELNVLSLNKATVLVRLLRKEGRLRNRSPVRGSTYLHHAVIENDKALLLRLVESLSKQPEEGLHLDVQNSRGHWASYAKPEPGPTIECLKQRRPLTLAAKHGRTALHWAVLVHNCLKVGPNGNQVIDTIPMVRELISHGASPLIKDVAGETALHYAVTKKRIDMVETLLDYGPSAGPLLGVCDRHGQTALHAACRLEVEEHLQVELVRQLVLNGACPQARDAQGLTPCDLLHPHRAQVHRWLSTPVTS